MSRMIKVTPECINEIRKDFETALQCIKVMDGKISYSKTFGSIDRKAVLRFDEKAWLKMQALITVFDKEVAWHGTAFRGEDASKYEYYITDILIYPQEVTGATVNTDQEKYEQWLMSQEDEVFNNLRMQGHSHVNMGTTPSGVDLTHQEKILDQLEDGMFYIFMIWNKRGDRTIKIYDLGKNILFDTEDITVEITEGDIGLPAFLDDAKKLVQDKKSVVQSYQPSYQNSTVLYGGYYGYDRKNYSGVSHSETAVSSSAAGNACEKKRKGRRKKSGIGTTYSESHNSGQTMPWLEEDDDLEHWYTK